MNARPVYGPDRSTSEAGWDQATFRCGLCGAERTAATETDYIRVVSAHRDAHDVFGRLNQTERNGMGSILRVLLEDVTLSTELLELIDTDPERGNAPTSTPG
ncbi:hypothetical protein [Streptomyces zaomyceticus]|uniref:hypothetical protein n=1 Tax=Streptomyces zaomyceticus TaxID=68286 RepID=UPI0036BF8AC5